MEAILFLIILFIFLYSTILHEISHGLMADFLGDPTAKLSGRLSLNPLLHLDPVGSFLLPLFLILMHSSVIFGWAKPVPVNYFNLRDKKYGMAKVALAGPLANFLVALIFGTLLRLISFQSSLFFQNLSLIFSEICWINLLLAIFNLVPIFPLDGSHILFAILPSKYNNVKIFFIRYQFIILFLFLLFGVSFLGPLINFIFKLITGTSLL
ncbi:MAG: site-2 protease family protein [Minisyncoccia bacterium]